MGDAVVAALVKEVLKKLTSEVIKEFGLLWGFKKDIETLNKDFTNIQAVLQDAEDKRVTSEAVELWLKSLRSASLEVENVLAETSTEALLQRIHKQRGMKLYKVRTFFSKVKFRVRIAHKVKTLRRKMEVINSKRFELSLTRSAVGHVDMDDASEMLDRESSSLIQDSSIIFGRDEEMEMVTKTICNKDIGKHENGEIRVYGIWGMGGLGKTTLAQLVYNHERVKQYFELKCWVYVSEKFQIKEIIKKIIESIDNHGCTLTLLDKLQESLRSKLNGKKILIVLDDVWIDGDDNEKTRWEELRKILSCGAEESIVVMTTRNNTTCQMFAKVPELQHKLGCLSNEDSWLLFKKLAFAQRREGADISVLESIGREIVEKCKGLPLAVKTLGSLMWSKSSISDWQYVKDNNIWELKENEVLPALKLSYDNLVPYIKRCFAYCCLFPKGYEMNKDVLIPLWVSNGFIPSRGGKDLYKLGEEILNCLVWRSFFVVSKFSVDKYTMHDLMHDMAQHVMRHVCLVIKPTGNGVIIPDEVLHLSSTCPDFHFSPKDSRKLTSLRSILMLGPNRELDINQISSHKYLRVLYLCGIDVRKLPDSIFKLKHLIYLNLSDSSIEVLSESIMYLQNLQYLNLSYSSIKVLPQSVMYVQNLQYLNLSYSSIKVLPESIVYLQNLQYLNLSKTRIEVLPQSIIELHNLQVLLLRYCQKLCNFPEGLRYMKNLQHLDIIGCLLLDHLPSGIKELSTTLRILSRFPIGKETGAKIRELGDLSLLERNLQIEGLENVRSLSEAKSANLKGKRNLSSLTLSWSVSRSWNLMFSNDEEVLEGLEPNPCLEELIIRDYKGKNISPRWMVILSNLVKITYSDCCNCEQLPALGRLPNLRVIDLWVMDSLKCFHDEDMNVSGDTTDMFPCVEIIKIFCCRNLVSLPSNFPKLEVLHLVTCDGLLSLPDKIHQNLNELLIVRCEHLREIYTSVDWPKISHIPKISFNHERYYGPEDKGKDEIEIENEIEIESEDKGKDEIEVDSEIEIQNEIVIESEDTHE